MGEEKLQPWSLICRQKEEIIMFTGVGKELCGVNGFQICSLAYDRFRLSSYGLLPLQAEK
jgi:hypothetical protein